MATKKIKLSKFAQLEEPDQFTRPGDEPTPEDIQRFNVGLITDHITTLVEVMIEELEEKAPDTTSSKDLISILSEIQNSLTATDSAKDMSARLSGSVQKMKSNNSPFAPKIFNTFMSLIQSIPSLFTKQAKKLTSRQVKAMLRKVISQATPMAQYPGDVNQTIALPSEGATETTLESEVDDSKAFDLGEEAPVTPEEVDQLSDKMQQVQDLMSQAINLIQASDFVSRKVLRRHKMVRRLVNDILKVRDMTDTIMRHVSKPRRR
jgi:hypothetical protein